MTIVTKPLSDKKQEPLKKPLVAAGEVQNGDVHLDVDASSTRYIIPTRPRVQRSSFLLLISIFIVSLLVLGAGTIGGLFMYRQFSRYQSHRMKGWLQIPGMRPNAITADQMIQKYEDQRPSESMMEEFDIDLDSDFANINVPDFGNGRRGRFIHDFNANKTGIVDVDAQRCFVMPLNRARVLPPRSMYDLINKIWQGYYEVDTQLVREVYEVEFPPINRVEEMGQFIFQECEGKPTYKLKQVVNNSAFKRSISDRVVYSEFAGNKVSQIEIIEDGLADYEKNHKV